MSSDGGVTLRDVVQAVNSLEKNNKTVNITSIRKFLGRGDHQRIKMLWKLLKEPEINKLCTAEASDKLIAVVLSENLKINAGVPGQLMEILQEINVLQQRTDDTFVRAAQVLSLAHKVIMVNVYDIGVLSDLQDKLQKEIAELRYLIEHKNSE